MEGTKALAMRTASASSGTERLLARALPLAGLLSLPLILSACLSGRYTYVSHTNSSGGDSYFRFPSSWTEFSQDQIVTASDSKITLTQLKQIDATEWAYILSANPRATLANQKGLTSPKPFGISQQIELTAAQKSNFSLAALRTVFLPDDPLAKTASLSGYKYKVLSYSQFSNAYGMKGLRLLVNVTAPNGLTSTLDEAAAVDKATQWVYFIGLGCTETCFSANGATIKQIVNSWSVKENK